MEDDGESLPRRAMLHGAAWSVPAISVLSMSPAWAASPASLRFAHPAYPSFVGDQVRMEVQRVSGGSSVAVSLAYSSGVTGPDTVVLDGASAYFFVTVDVAGPSTVSALSGADVATTVINALPPTFEALRRRWRLARVGAALDTSQPIPAVVSSVSSRIASAAASASNDQRSMTLTGSSLWSALPLGSKSFNMTSSAGRLQTLAISLRTSTSSLENDVSAGESVVAGISRLLTLVYKRDANEYDNWWDWQIATPLALLSAAIIAYDFTTPLLRAALVDAVSGHTTDAAIASSTGANRAWMAEVRMLAALLVEDPALMDSARAGLMPVYDSVTSGDGFYDDGSFVQHGYVAYTGAYGLVLWSILADVTFLPAGSVWEISAATQAKMLARVDDSLFPLLFSGLVPDAVSGRLNSDFTSSDHTRGHGLLAVVLTFAEQVDASTASRWRSLAKHSAQLDSWLPIQSDNSLSIAQSARFSALLNDGTIIPSPPALGGRSFTMMSRSVFRASRWNAIVSMSSNRTTWYEYGNDENRRGWHTGAGVLTWWDSAGVLGGQISDAYWPTADPYGHAGATLSRRPLPDGAGGAWRNRRPTTAWAGGAAVMAAAAIGAPVRVMGSTLRGAKSWFFSGDVIVCLGSGITSNDGYGVETSIDYRNLGAHGGNTVLIDGVAAATSAGSPETASGASWVHVDGHAGYAMIGAAQPVVVLRDDRAGSWSLMSVNGPKTTITRQYVRVFVDHGIDPQAATYSYVMLPGASPRETRDYAAAIEGTIQVLSQTDDVHAVRFTETDLRAINFWRAVPIAVADVRVTVPVSILFQPDGAASWIAVSDPQVTASTVDVTVSMAGTYTASDPRVSLVSDGASVTVRVDLSGLQGQTVTVPLDLL